MTFFFEIYTKDPVTKTTGWEIEVGTVVAESLDQAEAKVKDHFGNLFDEVIQLYQITSRSDIVNELTEFIEL